MSDLPLGFVLDSQQQASALPEGFVLDRPNAPAKPAPIRNVSDFIGALGDTTIGRMVKGAYGAVTLPGDVYTGKVQLPSSQGIPGSAPPETGQTMMEPSAIAQFLGAPASARFQAPADGSPMGRAVDLGALATPMSPRTAPSAAAVASKGPPTAEKIIETGGKQFDQFRDIPVDFDPNGLKKWAFEARTELERGGFNADTTPKVAGLLDKIVGTQTDGSVVTPANLDALRRTLGNLAFDSRGTSEGNAASRALQSLMGYLKDGSQADVVAGDATGASKLLADATGNYATGKKSEQITESARAAGINADAANSGLNVGNATRQQFKSMLKDSVGLTPEEEAQVDRIVRGTRTGNMARRIGNVLGGGGGLGQLAGIYAGASLGGAPGAIVAPTIGNIARALSNSSTQRQVRILDEMVRSRSPLAQSLQTPGLTPAQQSQRMALIRALLLQTPPPNQ